MVQRKLPPFPAIRAFEAAARLGSFKAAADELCVTASAVSHQVRALETWCDRALFERGTRQVTLTATGREYLAQLTPILDALDASSRALTPEGYDGRLRLKSTEGFARRWLMPRLQGFLARYPDVTVGIETGLPPTDFRGGELDVIVHWGDDPVPGVVVDPFMFSTRAPVCSPGYLARHSDLRSPADLLGHTLIRDEVQDGWADWFALSGLEASCPPVGGLAIGASADCPGGPVFAHCELTMSAAEAGLGVALGYKAMITTSLAEGTLVMPFELEVPDRIIYSLAYEEARRDDPLIVAFRDWLFETMLRDQHGLPEPAMLSAAQ